MNISILVPSKQKRSLIQHLKNIKKDEDEILAFNVGNNQITDVTNRMIEKAKNDYIILIDPIYKDDIDISAAIDRVPGTFFDKNTSFIGFGKSDFTKVNKKYISHRAYQLGVIQGLKSNPVPVNRNTIYNKISIIIPFMFNGDR